MSREKLKSLEELQRIDLQIRDLATAAEQHPARLRQIENQRNQARSALDGLRGKLADNERARRQQQDLLGLEREKVKKWEARLNELKTPREYAALARELDIAKKTNQGAELEIQRLTTEYDTIKASSAEGEKTLGEKDAVAAREGKEIEAILADVQKKMKTLEAARAEAVASCEKSLVNKYERIRKQRGGVAVVPVIAGTCKGCQMNIPPQMANNLRNNDEIQTCPSCHRFIYAAAEAAPDEASPDAT